MNANTPASAGAMPVENAKVFRAASSQEALALVEQEFGPEALVLTVRQAPGGAPWEVWKKPGVEMVALPPAAAPAAAAAAAMGPGAPRPSAAEKTTPSARGKPAAPDSQAELQAALLKLAARLEEKRKAAPATPAPATPVLAAAGAASKAPPAPAPAAAAQPVQAPAAAEALEVLAGRMRRQGLDESLLEAALEACRMGLPPAARHDPARLERHLRSQFEARLRTARLEELISRHPAGARPGGSVAVCLLGPSGAGKTSACARLAARLVRQGGKKVGWLCADTLRSGAIAQARAYSSLLGLPLRLAYTPEELAPAAAELAMELYSTAAAADFNAPVILVDLPARNPWNKAEIVELAAWLNELPQRITCLALPATAREVDWNQALSAYGPFQPNGLILTKLDETGVYGSAVSLALRSPAPLVYLTDGADILDHLHPARGRAVVGLLFGEPLNANE